MNVLEKQRFYQSGHGPIYMRTAKSRLMVRGLGCVIVGGAMYGLFNLGRLIAGKKP